MFYTWMHWQIETSEIKNDEYVINDKTKSILESGDPNNDGVALACILDILMED